MYKLFAEAFKITNNCIILTIPMIFFIKILDLYSFYSKLTVDSLPKFILASVTILFMFGVFCAGWFYMVKEAIILSKKIFVIDADRAKATFNLFKMIPEGVGKFFISFCGVYVIFFFLQILLTPLVYLIGLNLIGGLNSIPLDNLQQLAVDSAGTSVANFVESLTPEQIVFMGKWSLLLMVVTSIVMFLLMLWIPEIIYKTPNPLVALWQSLVKVFKDFYNVMRLYLSLWFVGVLLLFISTFAVMNPFAYIVISIIMFYYTAYLVVLIFLYYNKKYVEFDE